MDFVPHPYQKSNNDERKKKIEIICNFLMRLSLKAAKKVIIVAMLLTLKFLIETNNSFAITLR